jgi:hypothetical protein
MGHPTSRQERRAEAERVVAHRFHDWLKCFKPDEWDERRAGRARKVHPFNCGNPRCFVCKYPKVGGKMRPRDRKRLASALADQQESA